MAKITWLILNKITYSHSVCRTKAQGVLLDAVIKEKRVKNWPRLMATKSCLASSLSQPQRPRLSCFTSRGTQGGGHYSCQKASKACCCGSRSGKTEDIIIPKLAVTSAAARWLSNSPSTAKEAPKSLSPLLGLVRIDGWCVGSHWPTSLWQFTLLPVLL